MFSLARSIAVYGNMGDSGMMGTIRCVRAAGVSVRVSGKARIVLSTKVYKGAPILLKVGFERLVRR